MKQPTIVLISIAALAFVAGEAASQTGLADGGFVRRGDAGLRPPARAAGHAPGPLELRRLQERLASGPVLDLPALPKTIGDRLVVSLDDDGLPSGVALGGEYEARLDVSGGAAGASDWIAVRFPARDLASGLPVAVNDVVLGLDDLNGAWTFPAVEVWLEDPAEPLTPRVGAGMVNAGAFDAVAAGLTGAPAGSLSPTAFERLPVGLPSSLELPADWLSDAAFDDDFERVDQPLDDLAGYWLECEGDSCCDLGGCGFDRSLAISGNAVTRGAGAVAPTLAIRFPDVAVDVLRPAVDIDARVSATIDVSDAAAGLTGLVVRALAPNAYYAVVIDPVPSPDQVVALAITPTGFPVELGREDLVGDGGARAVSVEALGVNPTVSLVVDVDGNPHGPFTDDVYRWAGSLSGIVAGTPGSSGERWDDFVVERRRDVFVTVQLPPGEDAGLALDVSEGSVAWRSVLTTSDGATWDRLASSDPAFCLNPGSPFVQLEMEETDAAGPLFVNEARITSLGFDCPTCPVTRNRCGTNASALERFPALPTVGENLSVQLGWWNEHVGDDRLLVRTSILDSDCDAAGNVVASALQVVADVPGQATGGPAYQQASGLLDFAPMAQGSYCLVVEEYHDTNADCCADGAEALGVFDDPGGMAGCPGACTPTLGSDSNAATSVFVRDFEVFEPCTPADVMSDMDGGSLRLAKTGGGDPISTDLLLLDDTRTIYNVHAMEAAPFDTMSCFEEVAPIFDRLIFSGPVGNEVTRTYELPAPAGGRALWLAAFETDGCPSALSLPDSSMSDLALGSCNP